MDRKPLASEDAHLWIGWIQNGVQASNSTVWRRLKEAGLVAIVALKKSLLTAVHCRKRLQFALAHADWTWVDLSIVLWSDESRFTPFQNDGRVFVRRPHEAYRNSCVVPILKFGGDGLTVWVAMLYIETGFLTPLNGNLNKKDGYLDILRNSAISSAHLLGYGDNFIFQDHGAPCHRVNVVKQWKSDQRCVVWNGHHRVLISIPLKICGETLERQLGMQDAITSMNCNRHWSMNGVRFLSSGVND